MEKVWRTKIIIAVLVLFFIFTDRIYAKEWDIVSLDKVLENIQKETGLTSQIEVLGVEYEEDKVVIDLSKELISYGGGTYTEYVIGAKLMEWVFENSDADLMGIKVEGEFILLPEGSDYSTCTRTNYEAYYKIP